MVRNHRETPVSCDKSSLRQASSRLDGKEVGRNLVLQATRVHAVHTASATHPRAFHSSDSPPQRDGSSCPAEPASAPRRACQQAPPVTPRRTRKPFFLQHYDSYGQSPSTLRYATVMGKLAEIDAISSSVNLLLRALLLQAVEARPQRR